MFSQKQHSIGAEAERDAREQLVESAVIDEKAHVFHGKVPVFHWKVPVLCGLMVERARAVMSRASSGGLDGGTQEAPSQTGLRSGLHRGAMPPSWLFM